MKLNLLFTAAVLAGLATAPALAADYDITDKSPLVELHLRIPATAMTIAPLKDKILALYKADADQAKSDAKEDKQDNPSFHPYSIDAIWRATFESDAVLSLSAETNADTGGAHPNQGFQTLVWDKKANRAVPIAALFAPDQANAALAAIADSATTPGPDPTPSAVVSSLDRTRTSPRTASARTPKNSRITR